MKQIKLREFVDAAWEEFLKENPSIASSWHAHLGQRIIDADKDDFNQEEYIDKWLPNRHKSLSVVDKENKNGL